MELYRVRIAKDELGFSAGHFITMAGNQCERVHGHNYRVAAEVAGPLDANHYVIDFLALRAILRDLVAELDHRMLLPSQNPHIQVVSDAKEVTVTFADRRWVFPRGDCVVLSIANTTAELLARYLGVRLQEELDQRGAATFSALRIEVDESTGQSASWELTR